MTGMKTRPQDNLHCFHGIGQFYWLTRARGMDPEVRNGRDGYHIRFRTEAEALDRKKVPNPDSFAVQNGGIISPQKTRMPLGFYYRFIGSNRGNPTGNWWLEPEHYFLIRSRARDLGIPLAVAASRCLVIPKEWGDCGRVVRAQLHTRLNAYVGKGKPATGSVSPDNATRDKRTQPVHMAPTHIEIKQWYVPGEPELLARMFKVDKTVNVLEKGVAI